MGWHSTRDTSSEVVEAVGATLSSAGERAAELAAKARENAGPLKNRVVDGATELAHRSEPLRERASAGAVELYERTEPLRERAAAGAVEFSGAAAPVVGSAVDSLGTAFDGAVVRTGAAWEALRGQRVGPPVAVRRWPWALAALIAGAAAGAATAGILDKINPPDAAGAQEPHELKAVVDHAGTGPAGTGPAGTGPAGTGPAGTGPAGTGPTA